MYQRRYNSRRPSYGRRRTYAPRRSYASPYGPRRGYTRSRYGGTGAPFNARRRRSYGGQAPRGTYRTTRRRFYYSGRTL